MITYQFDEDMLRYVEKKLGAMKSEARRVLRNAVNKTAVSARVKLRQEAQKRYTVKAAGVNARIDIEKATLAAPSAALKVKGRTLTMPRFRYTAPKGGVKAEIIKGKCLRTVEGPRRIKAFVARTQGLVMQREGEERYPLKVLRSVSVPKMIEMVYDGRNITSTPLREEIDRLYRHYVEQETERMLST